MTTLPTLFVSHGAPTLAIEDGPARRYLLGLAARLPRPRAIVMVSAHFNAQRPAITASAHPETIYDFGRGFPAALFKMRYPAPGDPALAAEIRDTLQDAGFVADLEPNRGLDHGAWVPLVLAYPGADIPVLQLSISMAHNPRWHYELGQALEHLRHQGVLLVGSGSATHNLAEFFHGEYEHDDPAPRWVSEFSEWLATRITAGDVDAVLTAVNEGPEGLRNHPTMDHILPLFFALGAGGHGARARRVHQSTTYGVLAMDVYGFGAEPHLNALEEIEEGRHDDAA